LNATETWYSVSPCGDSSRVCADYPQLAMSSLVGISHSAWTLLFRRARNGRPAFRKPDFERNPGGSNLVIRQPQLIATLGDVSEKAEIINIVNALIEENGLSPAGAPGPLLKTSRKAKEPNRNALPCPKCGSVYVVKNGSAHGKSRFHCKDCGTFFGSSSGTLKAGTTSSDAVWDAFIEGMLRGRAKINIAI